MDENVKNNQLSDEELDNVTGGEARPLGNDSYYVNEKANGCFILECPKCGNKYYILKDASSVRKFKYNYGVSGDNDNFYCPDCYPKVKLEYKGTT